MITSKMDFAKNFLALKKLLFPGTCSLCLEQLDASQQTLCSNCIKKLPYVDNFCLRCAEPLPCIGICPACQKKPPNFRRCFTLCDYSYPVSSAIQQIKNNPYAAVTKQLSLLFAEHLLADYKQKQIPQIIIPVPIHPLKILTRGFNQTETIASFISTRLGKSELLTHIFSRKYLGKAQQMQTRQQRMKLLATTFKINNQFEIKGKSIALVDDVITTGSTAKAATASLLKAGAKSVDLWCIAKTSWHNHSSSIKM